MNCEEKKNKWKNKKEQYGTEQEPSYILTQLFVVILECAYEKYQAPERRKK